MITYVNTVLVSNLATAALLSAAPAAAASMNTASADAGKFIIENLDADAASQYAEQASGDCRLRSCSSPERGIQRSGEQDGI